MIVKLNRIGYEPFIDFLKGICIIMVIINHGFGSYEKLALFPIWIYQAVPLFLLIQVFHSYKKKSPHFPKFNKLWHRIVLPFIIVELVFLLLGIFKCSIAEKEYSIFLLNFIKNGGGGPGSYYIYVYIQFAILLPLLYKLVNKKYSWIYFILLSILIEFVCSLVKFPDYIYRLLFIRYFYLIYLGYIWTTKGIELNMKNFILAVVSIVAILFLFYKNMDLQPIVYKTSWMTFHWFAYYLPWTLLPVVFYKLYQLLSNIKLLSYLIIIVGERSYEIFLFQMLVFGLAPTFKYCHIIYFFICFLPVLIFDYKKVLKLWN